MKEKIGLCLSGGGLRAIAHIGVIKALEENNIKADYISGTSAGAIIGALIANGYKAEQLMEIVGKNGFFDRKSFKLSTSGILGTNQLINIFKQYLPINDFKALKTPLYIAATDINSGHICYFSKGEIYKPLLASAAVPFVFPSTDIDEHTYCDGGLLNNLPIEPLAKKKVKIIASHVNAISDLDAQSLKKLSPKAFIERLFHVSMANQVNIKKDSCSIFIEPPNLVQYSMFDKKNAQTLFDLGYQYAMKALAQN